LEGEICNKLLYKVLLVIDMGDTCKNLLYRAGLTLIRLTNSIL